MRPAAWIRSLVAPFRSNEPQRLQSAPYAPLTPNPTSHHSRSRSAPSSLLLALSAPVQQSPSSSMHPPIAKQGGGQLHQQQPPPSRTQVAGVVAFYMAAALFMVMVNKAVLNSSPSLPFSFLFVQMMIAVVLLKLGSIFLPEYVQLEPLTMANMLDMAPLVSLGVVGLVFNTLCLRSVDATFFQIARGMVLPLTIVAQSVFNWRIPGRSVLIAAAIVTVGFLIGSSPGANFVSKRSLSAKELSNLGLIFGFISSAITAVHAVARKWMLNRVPSIVNLSYRGNIISSAFLLLFLLINQETGPAVEMWSKRNEEGSELRTFFIGGAVTGVVGLMLSLAGALSIKVTSPTTHMFSSAGRSVLQTVLGVAIFKDIITTHRILSLAAITSGTLYYTLVQSGRSTGGGNKTGPIALPPTPVEKGVTNGNGLPPAFMSEKNGSGGVVFSEKSDLEKQ